MKSLQQIRRMLTEAIPASQDRDEGVLQHLAQDEISGKKPSKKDVNTISKASKDASKEVQKHEKEPIMHEALNAEKDPVDKWIADYTKSTDPRFKGMDKSKRIKMALSDFAAAQKASGKKTMAEDRCDSEHELEEISMTRAELDEIADMADDLYNVLPTHDECPAWVQHKVAGIHASLHGIYDYYRRKSIERQSAAYAAAEIGSSMDPNAVQIALPSKTNPVATPLPVPPSSM